jgi:iron(III) transport system substrate-binding protein
MTLLGGCRIETATPGAGAATPTGRIAGDVWVYTSMYRHVLDALDPVLKQQLPDVTVHWFQAGSEKIAAKLEAELAAGGSPCDVLVTSDPFVYQRFKQEHRWLRYVSPNGVRTARSFVDPDGNFEAVRLSTMVLVHRTGSDAPKAFAALVDPAWKDQVAIGDPLSSGTAFTWSVFMDQQLGPTWASQLRANDARVAGGNAAVLQKLEGNEATVGVLLLENALAAKAKGSPIDITWPEDGAVVIPGYEGIFATTRNPEAAKAVVDLLLSAQGQALIVERGDMHGVDPRLLGPRGTGGDDELLQKSRPWSEALLDTGLTDGARVKQAFTQAFSK